MITPDERATYGEGETLAEELPLFPLGTVLFPGMVLPLHIFEGRYRKLIARHMRDDPIFGVVLTRLGREVVDEPDIHGVGTAATLLKAVRYPDGQYDIAVTGNRRFRVVDGHWDEGYMTGRVEWLDTEYPRTETPSALKRLGGEVTEAFFDYVDAVGQAANIQIERADFGVEPVGSAYAICSMMPFDQILRQRLLTIVQPAELLRELLLTLRRERKLLVATGIGGAASERPVTRFSAN